VKMVDIKAGRDYDLESSIGRKMGVMNDE